MENLSFFQWMNAGIVCSYGQNSLSLPTATPTGARIGSSSSLRRLDQSRSRSWVLQPQHFSCEFRQFDGVSTCFRYVTDLFPSRSFMSTVRLLGFSLQICPLTVGYCAPVDSAMTRQ